MRRLDRLTRIPGTLSLLFGVVFVVLAWVCIAHHLPVILFIGAFVLTWVALLSWGVAARRYLRERETRSKP